MAAELPFLVYVLQAGALEQSVPAVFRLVTPLEQVPKTACSWLNFTLTTVGLVYFFFILFHPLICSGRSAIQYCYVTLMFDCHCESRCNRLVAIPEIASQTTLAMTEGGELSEICVTEQ